MSESSNAAPESVVVDDMTRQSQSLEHVSTQELEAELARRGEEGRAAKQRLFDVLNRHLGLLDDMPSDLAQVRSAARAMRTDLRKFWAGLG